MRGPGPGWLQNAATNKARAKSKPPFLTLETIRRRVIDCLHRRTTYTSRTVFCIAPFLFPLFFHARISATARPPLGVTQQSASQRRGSNAQPDAQAGMDEHMGQELNFQGDDEPGCNSFEWVQEGSGNLAASWSRPASLRLKLVKPDSRGHGSKLLDPFLSALATPWLVGDIRLHPCLLSPARLCVESSTCRAGNMADSFDGSSQVFRFPI
ncbi:hypothetical protein VTI28DRAFT_8755 [Corynascus sepedonium]